MSSSSSFDNNNYYNVYEDSEQGSKITGDGSNFTFTSSDYDEEYMDNRCDNCCRSIINTEYVDNNQLYLHSIASTEIQKKRKFKLIHDMNYVDEEQIHTLCQECYEHLTAAKSDHANKPEFTWPSFIWYLLTDKDIFRTYSKNYLWKFIPKAWRYWWVHSFNNTIVKKAG